MIAVVSSANPSSVMVLSRAIVSQCSVVSDGGRAPPGRRSSPVSITADKTAAPAEVPPMTAPALNRARMAARVRVSRSALASRTWSPPPNQTPVAASSRCAIESVSAWSWFTYTFRAVAPRARRSAAFSSPLVAPDSLAMAKTTMFALPRPPAIFTNSSTRASGCGPPPTMKSVPRCASAGADGAQRRKRASREERRVKGTSRSSASFRTTGEAGSSLRSS